jgi:hypothetical protein
MNGAQPRWGRFQIRDRKNNEQHKIKDLEKHSGHLEPLSLVYRSTFPGHPRASHLTKRLATPAGIIPGIEKMLSD